MKLGNLIHVLPQDLYVESTTAQAELGATAFTEDGRAFRYSKVGGANLVVGNLLQASAEVAANQDEAPTATSSIGATSIAVTSMTATLNELAGGYAVVTTAPGLGDVYLISGNTAMSASAGTVYLAEPVRVAITTSSRVDFVKAPCNGVIQNPASASSNPVGVAIRVATAATYGWIQVAGVAGILNDGGSGVGTNVVASNATAGAVEALTGTQAIVGTAVTAIATTEVGAVKLVGLL